MSEPLPDDSDMTVGEILQAERQAALEAELLQVQPYDMPRIEWTSIGNGLPETRWNRPLWYDVGTSPLIPGAELHIYETSPKRRLVLHRPGRVDVIGLIDAGSQHQQHLDAAVMLQDFLRTEGTLMANAHAATSAQPPPRQDAACRTALFDALVLLDSHDCAATIARVAHEINRAYCAAIGDDSQPEWKDAPEWQKQSAINGATFHLWHPDVSPQDSHENWCREKLAAGWKYGPCKDPEKKEHPCLVPYHELPVEQRAKDYIFSAVVRSLQRIINTTITITRENHATHQEDHRRDDHDQGNQGDQGDQGDQGQR